MTKRINKTNLIFLLASVIFFSLMFVANSVKAGCISDSMTCNGTIDRNPPIEKNCVDGEVWCEPAAFPIDTAKKIGDPCPDGTGCPNGSSCVANAQSVFVCTASAAATSCSGTCKSACTSSETRVPNTDCEEDGSFCCVIGNNNNNNNNNNNATGGGWSLNSISGFGLPSGSILGIISGILTWLLGALGILGVIGFVISGILYLVSTGDETMIERAKSAMTWSIVGVIVGLLGVVIIQAIDWMLRGFSNF